MNEDILMPFFGTMMLTVLVWLYMYTKRLGYIATHDVNVESLPTPESLISNLPDSVNNPSNNLKNLFELPVIFYPLCLYLYLTAQVDQVHVVCAYTFFIGRCVHSAIQCTINRVMYRFAFYLLSSLALFVMVIRCFVGLALEGL
ncbi:MAG: MAPEG family protein [Gammaproteobacteria bacterium]|nr:MAPEG family protein [Gammaproteobacteria bacterium]